MDTDITVALIGIAGVLAGALVSWFLQRGKNKADITKTITDTAMSLIQPLKAEIEDLKKEMKRLKTENASLKEWAEALCCQIKELGKEPVEFKEND
jgi:FtsZ-binding cell division protein ZapB